MNRSPVDDYCKCSSVQHRTSTNSFAGHVDVRMRYQNMNISLPICADGGKHLPGHPEFCTLAAFRDRVQELTPVDWDAECAPDGKAG